jgi:hypothetical protein
MTVTYDPYTDVFSNIDPERYYVVSDSGSLMDANGHASAAEARAAAVEFNDSDEGVNVPTWIPANVDWAEGLDYELNVVKGEHWAAWQAKHLGH